MSKNAILIVQDQLVNYKLLPDEILNLLPGYNAFKNNSIEYNKAICNRLACSPARSVIQTSIIDTGIQDSINSVYQKEVVNRLNPAFNTAASLFKNNNYTTSYVGKSHLYDLFDDTVYEQPVWGNNTRDAFKIYDFDTFNTYGDATNIRVGMYHDSMYLETIMPPNAKEYDYYDINNDMKLTGILPILRARAEDKKLFYIEYHLTNPHDIHECKMNVSQSSSGHSLQYYFPFMEEQLKDNNIDISPYYFNEQFTDAFIKHKCLTTNYFESKYNEYKNNISSLKTINSFIYDFCLDPKTNKINPYYVGIYKFFESWTTCAKQNDLVSWKNLINTYYGLIIEADSYVFKIYEELKKLNLLDNTCVIITSDHGELASAHGMRSKGVPLNEGISIPFLVYDKNISEHNISEYLCSQIDIIPTFGDLCNLNYSNYGYIGASVIEKNGNSIYSKKINNDNTAITLSNLNDGLMMYFLYIKWYNDASIYSKSLVDNNPNNWFEWQYAFIMECKYVNNTLYKYGRFFSLTDLLYENTTESSSTSLLYLNSELNNYISNGDVVYIKVKSVFNKIFPKSEFSIYTGLNIIYSIFGKGDNIYLFTYFALIFKQLSTANNNRYYLPGYNKDYYTIKKENKLRLFCYDMTNDKDEIYNLLDKMNYNINNDNLFYKLNNSLNLSMETYNCNNILYIIPYNLILSTIVNVFDSITYEFHSNSLTNVIINFSDDIYIPKIDIILNIVKESEKVLE
jgi:arylsulfatase A-like enzyme